jgi:hypothetical protein
MGDADYILAFQKIVMPIALEFAPELVISQPLFPSSESMNPQHSREQFQLVLMPPQVMTLGSAMSVPKDMLR